jgi:hypothetical protein
MILLPASADNEYYHEVNYACVDPNKALIKKRVRTAKLLKRLDPDLVKLSFWDNVAFICLSEEQIEDLRKQADNETYTGFMYFKFEPAILGKVDPARTEADQIKINPDSGVSWMGYDHYIGTTLTSEHISLKDIELLMRKRPRERKRDAKSEVLQNGSAGGSSV